MPVSEGIWASIESQIPVKKEKPKTWLLFLLAAFALPYLILTYQSSDVSNDLVLADGTNKNSIAGNKVEKEQILDLKNQQKKYTVEQSGTVPSNDYSSTEENNIDYNLLRNSNETSVTSFAGVNVSKAESSDYGVGTVQPLSRSKSMLLGSSPVLTEAFRPTSKKLKILNNPFEKKSKNSAFGDFKLIEKSRTYRAATQVNKVTTLNERFYSGGLCYNHNKRLDRWGNEFRDERASVAICPSFDKHYSGFYVYIDANYGYSFQNLTSQFEENNSFAASRSAQEKGALSISANVGIGKKWHNGFLLETGLNYDRININADNYSDQSGSRLLIRIDSVMTPTGWLTTVDSTYITNDEKIAPNRFTQFNFPLAVGYELYLQDGISLIAKTGVLFNITSSNSGTLVDEDGNSFIYNSNNPLTRFYKTNLGLSFLANLQVQKELTPLIAGYIGMNVNYYPNNFSLSDNPIKQTYTKVGMTTGLTYRL